jgi:hypothetical protein
LPPIAPRPHTRHKPPALLHACRRYVIYKQLLSQLQAQRAEMKQLQTQAQLKPKQRAEHLEKAAALETSSTVLRLQVGEQCVFCARARVCASLLVWGGAVCVCVCLRVSPVLFCFGDHWSAALGRIHRLGKRRRTNAWSSCVHRYAAIRDKRALLSRLSMALTSARKVQTQDLCRRCVRPCVSVGVRWGEGGRENVEEEA